MVFDIAAEQEAMFLIHTEQLIEQVDLTSMSTQTLHTFAKCQVKSVAGNDSKTTYHK